MIHSNAKFKGKYWNSMQQLAGKTVVVNAMDKITHFGKEQIQFIEHIADYAKLSQALKHGGLALDFDVVLINASKLYEAQRLSECVLIQDEDGIRVGFFSCVKNSPYLKAIVESYNHYIPFWTYNSGDVPTKLLLDESRSDCFNVFVDIGLFVVPLIHLPVSSG